MSKTFFLLANLNSKSKEDINFIKNAMRDAFDKLDGSINLVLSPRERLLHIDPRLINKLKKAEKTGKFKVKEFKDQKKKYEKILNKMFNHNGFVPENYCVTEFKDLLLKNKYRIKIYVLPITQQMLCYDWRCKLLLNNSNLNKNESLVNDYIRMRLDRTNISNNEIVSFLSLLKGNTIVLIDEIHHGVISKYPDNNEFIFPNNRVFIPNVIIKDEVINQKLYK
jgi:hypothetical protein